MVYLFIQGVTISPSSFRTLMVGYGLSIRGKPLAVVEANRFDTYIVELFGFHYLLVQV